MKPLCEGNHVGCKVHLTAHIVAQLGQSGSGLSMCRLGGHAACRCQARCPSCGCVDLSARVSPVSGGQLKGVMRKWSASAEQGSSGVFTGLWTRRQP